MVRPVTRSRIRSVRGLMLPEEVERLAALAAEVPSWQTIIEVGTHTALSTVWLASGAEEGFGAHVVAIDPYPDPRPGSKDDPFGLGDGGALREARDNLTRVGYWHRVTLLRAYGDAIAATWQNPVGLVFIDSVHEFDHFLRDYASWGPRIEPGGWLVCHDYSEEPGHEYEGVARALREVVLPGGLWDPPVVTANLWTARRRP